MTNQKGPVICVERNYYHMDPFPQERQEKREIQEVRHIPIVFLAVEKTTNI